MPAAVFSGPRTDTSRRRQLRTTPVSIPARADHWSERRDTATGKKFFATVRVPYINSETRARMRAAGADRTWDAFWRLVFQQQARGRTAATKANAWQWAILDDVGVSGLAREARVSPSTTRRHLRVLVDQIGILRTGSPRVVITRDDSPKGTKDENGRPIRGRITGKQGGRQAPTRIWFQPDERHSIPDAKAKRTSRSYGARCAMAGDDGASLMAHGAPAFREDEIKTTTPTPDTAGVGAVVASGEAAGLTAGEASGLPAATTEGEARETPRPHWPSPADPPHVSKPEPPSRPARPHGDGQPEKSFKERADEWNRRDPETERMVADYQRSRAQRKAKAAAGTSAVPPAIPTPDRPSGATAGAVPAIQPDAEFDAAAQALDELIRGMRQSAANDEKAGHRDEWRASRVGAA